MDGKKRNFGLTPYDDLFETDESRAEARREKVMDIPISEVDSFLDHPFKVKVDEAMQEMAESVKKLGILTPVVVRKKEDGRYELISGHRRRMACELAGLNTIPAIVREMSRDEAVIFMVDSNLQREIILPSEKAFSYKMRLEAMKRQGQRTDLTSSPLGTNLRSDEQLAQKIGESRNQIQRYIRLTELLPEMLQMVDDNKIAFRPAVELSYLPKEEQKVLLTTIKSEDSTPSLTQAQRVKKLSQEGRLTEDVIYSILSEEKPNQKEKVVLSDERFEKFFPQSYSAQQKIDLLAKLLENWYQRQRESER